MNSVQVFYPKWTTGTLIRALEQRVAQLHRVLPLKQAVLFGSWSRARASITSDIDVLIVYRGDVREGAYARVWRALALPGLELHLYSEGEAAHLQNVLDKMTLNGVSLLPQTDP